MNTKKIDESSHLVATTGWGAIAAGVFIALALQALLVSFGYAVGVSVGDRAPAGGFVVWSVLASIVSLAFGAALAARISHAGSQLGGITAGILVWAVAVVIGNIFVGGGAMARVAVEGAWGNVLGILLGFGAAVIGGIIGATLGRPRTATQIPSVA